MMKRATASGSFASSWGSRVSSTSSVAMRVLAGLVQVELVVGVLHERHAQALAHEDGHDALDEGGLAAAAVARDADDLHGTDSTAGRPPRPRAVEKALALRDEGVGA